MLNEHFLQGLQTACRLGAEQYSTPVLRRIFEKVGQRTERALFAPINLHWRDAMRRFAFACLQFIARIRFQLMQKIIAPQVQLGRFQ